jgi:aminoglycoside phosphotransferase family enzyme/predicted kinase
MSLQNPAGIDSTHQIKLEELLQDLSRKCAFPMAAEDITVRQTHISVVFLAGDAVYKVKKPVKLPFLDFSTVELRHHFCEEEIRVNRPWAPGVYLGVVPITREADGLQFEGSGPVVDWAVKMQRLPESATLRSRLQNGQLQLIDLERTAIRIAGVHTQARSMVPAAASAADAEFRRYWAENWDFAETLSVDIVHPDVWRRLSVLANEWMQRHESTLTQRALDGRIRDVHGDLRLEHIFLFPERPSPNDLVIIDGIEFSESLRRIDVVADIAFLVMELSFAGRRDWARSFAAAWFSEMQDDTGNEILPLFAVYRSAIRGKVAALLAAEPEAPEAARAAAIERSRAHWLWCLSELEDPDRRPALILVSGLPGTGKSTLSRELADVAHFEVIRSDVVRKEIFADTNAGPGSGELYAPENTQRVYDVCCSRAQSHLLSGGRVLVDATFQREANRQQFLQLAIDCGIRAIWLECTAPADVVRRRLEVRRGDASDADWSIYELVRMQWEPGSAFTERNHATVESGDDSGSTLKSACDILTAHGLR